MTTDARAAAWLTAWDCLIAADKCRKVLYGKETKFEGFRSEYREEMTELQRQAELFTALANVPEEVGLIAGVELERRRDTLQANIADVNSMVDKLREHLNDTKEQP